MAGLNLLVLKLKKDTTEFDLVSGNRKGTAKVKTKRHILFLVWEGLVTLGIGTVVDLSTKAHIYTNDYFIDVPAYLEGKKPRTQEELRIAALESPKK